MISLYDTGLDLPRCEELSGVHVRQVLNFVTMQRKQQKAGWYESKLEEAKIKLGRDKHELEGLSIRGSFL
jgi:hypothetical protein